MPHCHISFLQHSFKYHIATCVPHPASDMKAFTTLGHRNTWCRVLAGGCFHGIRCPLLTTFSKWYCSFGFIENYGHSHLSPYTKNFALKSSGRRYVCSLANKWPALGTRARAAALVQSGEDFCKAGYLSLWKEQADETPGITLISLQLLWDSLCSTAFCQVDILVKLIYA